MEANDFTADAPGELIQATNSTGPYWAFVPKPLPPSLSFDLATIGLISEAERNLGRLAGAGQNLPNPHLLIGPFLRREAILSSRIEGTISSAEELLLFEVDASKSPSSPDVQEVSNYVRAMEYGLQRMKDLPVCLRLARELHAKLLEGVRGNAERPGEFRDVQNFIGKKGQPIQLARFIPPPIPQMNTTMRELENFWGNSSDLPVLVQLALIHYQFETIHPFRDGNGRIGRLLITLLLCERQLLPEPMLYLSAYLEKHRDEYMNHLLSVSQRGTWIEWIQFFLRGIIEQSQDALGRLSRLQNLWKDYRHKAQTGQSSALCLQFIDELFRYPAVSVSAMAKRLKVTHRTAQLNVNKLVAFEILKEISDRKRNRVYVAQEIISAIEN